MKNQKNSKIESCFPLAGKSSSKTYLSYDEGFGVIKYNSDRFSFRNNDENWDKIFKNIQPYLLVILLFMDTALIQTILFQKRMKSFQVNWLLILEWEKKSILFF